MDYTNGTVSLAKRSNVTLCVGNLEQGALWIEVSSASMSDASSVFEVMFDGRFIEGQALSFTTPHNVALPDDNPFSMLLICQIVHMKNSDIPRLLEIDSLADFAVLCNKYNCVDVVRAWSRVWVLELLQKPEAPGFEKLIMATYVLDLPDEFCKITRSLIIDRTFSVDIEIAAHGTDFVPLKVFAQLHRAQKLYYNKIGHAAMPSLDSEVTSLTCARKVYAAYMYETQQVGIVPAGAMSLRSYRDRCATIPPVADGTCSRGDCFCKRYYLLQSTCLASVDQVIHSVQGMCLDWVLIMGHKEEQCRLQHKKSPY